MRILCLLLARLACGVDMDWRRSLQIGSIGGYPSYDEANDILNFFLFKYPHLLRRELIGKSFEDRDIFAYRLFSESVPPLAHAPRLLLTSLMHGREPVTLTVSLFTMGSLLEEYTNNVTDTLYLVRTRELYIVPFVNPDAYAAGSAEGEFKYRKNRRPGCPGKPDSDGVDLNRNFGFHWAASSDPCSEEYSGSHAFSEPETKAIATLGESIKVTSALHLHSYGEILTYPFNWNASERMQPKHEQFFAELQKVLRFDKAGPASETLRYITAGEATDYFYGALGALAMSPEIGLERDGFAPKSERGMEIARTNYQRLRYWMFKSGPELSLDMRIVEDGVVQVRVNNSGLFQSSEYTNLVVHQPGCDIQETPLSRVDSLSTSGNISIHACKGTNLRSQHSQACIVELGLSCRCFDTSGLDANNLFGRISNFPFAATLCKAGGITEFNGSDNDSHEGSESVWPVVALVLALSLIAGILLRIAARNIAKPSASYVEIQLTPQEEDEDQFTTKRHSNGA